MTLHTLFGLPVNQCGGKMVRLDEATANTMRTKLNGLKLLIIDEISMVGATIFKYLDERLRQIFHSTEMFAGISIIAVGDFNQLPPVGDSMIFQTTRKDDYEILAGPCRWELFSIYELDEIMRQKDDLEFAQALNNLANNCLTENNIELFNSRCFENSDDIPEQSVHLFPYNASVDKFNFEILQNLKTEGIISKAHDHCSSEIPNSMRDKALTIIKSYSKDKTYGLPLEINLKISGKYMITANVDVEDGLVNGATGTLMKISYGKINGKRIAVRLWILFEDENIGKNTREKWSNFSKKYDIDSKFTPLEMVTRSIQIGKKSSQLKVIRKQFPVVPSAAITIHKSQGDTYNCVTVHFEKRAISRRMLYVALSRAKSADGLYIIADKFKEPPNSSPNDPIIIEMKRMRENFFLKIDETLPTNCLGNISILFHNVQSLNKHEKQIHKYDSIFNFDILALCETLHKCEQNFEKFQKSIINHIPSKNGRGIAFLASKSLDKLKTNRSRTYFKSYGNGKYCEAIVTDCSIFDKIPITLMIVYKSPKCKKSAIRDLFESIKSELKQNILLIGDLNINLFDENELAQLEASVKNWNLKLIGDISNTTNLNTHLDVCLANFDSIEIKYFENLFSYHKPLNVIIKQYK